jgi:hypothetical protein
VSAVPLFLDDLAAVQQALRLTDLREDSDAIAILEQGVRAARVRFYQRLGPTTVAAILETVYTDAPETSAEMKRMVGRLCEVELIRLELLDRLPVIYMDASGSAREAFNSEGAFRSMDPATLAAIRARIEAQVENWLAILAGDIDLGDGELVQAYTQQPVDPKPVLGLSPFLGADGTSQPFGVDPGTFDGNFVSDDDLGNVP